MRKSSPKRRVCKRWAYQYNMHALIFTVFMLCGILGLVTIFSSPSINTKLVITLSLAPQPTVSNSNIFGRGASFPSHNAGESTNAHSSGGLLPAQSTAVFHPSGQPLPKGDIPGWHQIFAEDFNSNVAFGQFPGPAYNKKFALYADGTPDTAGQHGGNSVYYPSKVVSVNNGALNLYLHTENGRKMAAAILPILPGSHLYGKYSVRFRSDVVAGFKTAWLLWPDSENWPGDGEIDFPENNLTSTISGFVHHKGGTSGGDQSEFNSTVTDTSWHTTSIEWLPGKVTFLLDGAVVGTSTTRIPDTAMHWVLQTESCLIDCSTSTTSGNLQVDWVTAYAVAAR